MNEKFKCDFRECEKTCENPSGACSITHDKLCEKSCYCKDEFVRSFAVNGTCVSLSKCSEIK